jgi:hypothetical protein
MWTGIKKARILEKISNNRNAGADSDLPAVEKKPTTEPTLTRSGISPTSPAEVCKGSEHQHQTNFI